MMENFAIYWPQDGLMPCLNAEVAVMVKNVVVKVEMDKRLLSFKWQVSQVMIHMSGTSTIKGWIARSMPDYYIMFVKDCEKGEHF